MFFYCVFFVRKISCVRKVADTGSHIKTNVFLMILGFVRFDHRFRKVQKKHEKRYRKRDAKNMRKSSTKSSTNDAKTMKHH